jgi:GNAT superfamily N-acetyltransferase
MMPKALTKAEQDKHWYVFIMGTAVDRRKQGLAGALLRYMQDCARSDGRVLWLEATTEYSRDLYSKHGFTSVGEVVLGKGQVGPGGLPKKGGEGVTIWSMYWRP